MTDAPEITFYRLPKVIERVGMGRSLIYQEIKAGRFPAPLKIGGRISVWSSQAVNEWIEKQLSDSNAA